MKRIKKSEIIPFSAPDESRPDAQSPQAVSLRLGDVLRGKLADYIVGKIELGRARLWPLAREIVHRIDDLGRKVDFEKSKPIWIDAESNVVLIKRRGEQGLEEFSKRTSRRNEINQHQGGEQNNNMKTKTEKKSRNSLPFIVGLAKSGATEAKITAAVTKEFGAPSPSTAYTIGREWRRVNKVGRHFGGGKASKPAKASAKAGKGKVTPKAQKPAKSAPAPKKSASVPPPPPKTTPPVPTPTPAAN
jgi:hypothetical protein